MYINQKEQYEQLGFTIENALIKSVSISMADHGILTYGIVLEGSGWQCVYGGYCIGHGYLGSESFDGSGKGLEAMMRIMNTVGVEKWEDLAGKYIRVATKGWGNTIEIIGNVLEDKWFDQKEFFSCSEMYGKEHDVSDYYKFKKELAEARNLHAEVEDLETFRNEVYKILNVNKETWSDPDIYSTLKIQQERAQLYTCRENLEEKVPFMIEELYDLIRTPCSDKFLEQDIKDLYDVGVVTQQMFDYLKERIESFKENEDVLLEQISKIRKASSEAIESLREGLY